MKLNRRTAMGALIAGAAAGPDMAKQAMQENKWPIKEYALGAKPPGYDRNYLEQDKKYLEEILSQEKKHLEEILSDGYNFYNAYFGDGLGNEISDVKRIEIYNFKSVSNVMKEHYRRDLIIKKYKDNRIKEAKAQLEKILKQLAGL